MQPKAKRKKENGYKFVNSHFVSQPIESYPICVAHHFKLTVVLLMISLVREEEEEWGEKNYNNNNG